MPVPIDSKRIPIPTLLEAISQVLESRKGDGQAYDIAEIYLLVVDLLYPEEADEYTDYFGDMLENMEDALDLLINQNRIKSVFRHKSEIEMKIPHCYIE